MSKTPSTESGTHPAGGPAQESVIRLMTRLAVEHGAVNLAQGFTDEAPAYDMVWGGICALLGGTERGGRRLESMTLGRLVGSWPDAEKFLDVSLKDLLAGLQNPSDTLNQYSFPFGLPELRKAIAQYTQRFSGFRPDPETEVTVVLGSTEGLSSVLLATCQPGQGVIIVQPFHEMFPSQAQIFRLQPIYVTLREDIRQGGWQLDRQELARAAAQPQARALILNTPHNPTGKVFGRPELEWIAQLCQERDLILISDEIYEHIVYDGHQHVCPASLDGMRERTIAINSISKTGQATGWRVGWVISPARYTTPIRAIHDSLVIQAPTPLQKGAVRLLQSPPAFFETLRSRYQEKRQLLGTMLRQLGFRLSPPEGAYYLFANYRQVPALQDLAPMDAAQYLLREVGVACVPGDNFYRQGNAGQDYLRFAFCRSVATLREAVRRLSALSGGSGARHPRSGPIGPTID